MCQDGELILQADVDLVARAEDFEPVSLSVEPQGQGWRQASLSRDGRSLAGIHYRWTLVDDGKEYAFEGVLYDIQKGVSWPG